MINRDTVQEAIMINRDTVPEAVIVSPDTVPVVPPDVEVEEETKPFIQQLWDLEAAAKIKMATWDPMFLGSDQDDTKIPVGTKRKCEFCCKFC
jgi:hypothetical protein